MHSLVSEVDWLKRVRPRARIYRYLVIPVLVVVLLGIFFIFFDEFTLTYLGLALLLSLLAKLALNPLEKNYQTIFNTRLFCPNCRKHIPAFDPWMCPTCDEIHDIPALVKEYDEIEARNRALPKGAKKEDEFSMMAYSFIYRCSTCASVATTYKCHNCGEVIALREPANPDWFAYNPVRLPDGIFVEDDLKSQVDKIERKDRSKHPEVNDADWKLDRNDDFRALIKKREKYYEKEVEEGRMTREEARKYFKRDELYINRRMALG